MHEFDTAAYVSMLRELIAQGHEVSLVIKGNSMSPFLVDQRDTIYFRRPDTPLSVGQMVFYQRPNGQYVMHRICRIHRGQLYIVGDAQQDIEGPVDPVRVFARVTKVRRKDKLIGPGNLCWEFFEHIWIRLIPVRHRMVRLYTAFSRTADRGSRC